MPESAASIGASFSDYQGNANLAGGAGAVIPIDTKPLEMLAQYNYLANKSLWDQKQKDSDAAVVQLAKIADIDVERLYGKDKEEMKSLMADAANKTSDFLRKPIPTDAAGRIKWNSDLKNITSKATNAWQTAKERTLSFHTGVNSINELSTNEETKKVDLDEWTKRFNNTDIHTRLDSLPNYPMTKFEIPEPINSTAEYVGINNNDNLKGTLDYFNFAVNASIVDAGILNLSQKIPGKESDEYKKLTLDGKYQVDRQRSLHGDMQDVPDMADKLTSVLQKYVKGGVFNEPDFLSENAANEVVMGNYNNLKRMSVDSKQEEAKRLQGLYNNKNLQYKTPDTIPSNAFTPGAVDFSKPISATQLGLAGVYAKYTAASNKISVTHTGDATDITKANIQAVTTRRGQDLDYKAKMKELDNNEAKWKATQIGGTTQINGAMERAKRIYSDLLKLADKNGVISPEKTRLLNTEQLKYLGIEKPVTSSSGTMSNVFQPLTFKEDNGETISHAIQLQNGEVRVLKNAEQIDGGRFKGQFDREKSTNLFNIGTNILNEELKMAGSKELNSYMGVDVSNGITSTTSGGSSSVSGSNQQSTQNSTIPTLTTKSEFDALPKGTFYYRDGKKYQK